MLAMCVIPFTASVVSILPKYHEGEGLWEGTNLCLMFGCLAFVCFSPMCFYGPYSLGAEHPCHVLSWQLLLPFHRRVAMRVAREPLVHHLCGRHLAEMYGKLTVLHCRLFTACLLEVPKLGNFNCTLQTPNEGCLNKFDLFFNLRVALCMHSTCSL